MAQPNFAVSLRSQS